MKHVHQKVTVTYKTFKEWTGCEGAVVEETVDTKVFEYDDSQAYFNLGRIQIEYEKNIVQVMYDNGQKSWVIPIANLIHLEEEINDYDKEEE